MMGQGPPKPPYEMNFLSKMAFGMRSLLKRRILLKYHSKQSVKVLENLFGDKDLASIIWGYYPMHSIVLLAHVFGWEMVRREENYSVTAATPLTFERYTYNEKGSFLGWKMDRAHYGKFVPQTTPIENLYLVGHWVFPGFGVPGVMASGYYLAKKILEKDNIDLEDKMKSYSNNN